MRTHIIVTASGTDRPGVLEEFTKLLLAHDGNVEASRMAHLGGSFAMLMLVSAPKPKVADLQTALSELAGSDYEVHTRPTEPVEPQAGPGGWACGITVAGADYLGIVHQIASALADKGVNIETLNTEVVAAPMSGTPLFTMSAVVTVPRELTLEGLREIVDRLGHELGVNISVLSHGS